MSAPEPPPPPAPPQPVDVPKDSSGEAKRKKWTVQLPEQKEWKELFPFHAVCQAGDASSVSEFLKGFKLKINEPDDDVWTPLHYASFYGHLDVVSLLLQAKADVNAVDGKGGTALHLAAGCGHAATVKALLEAGSNVKVQNAEKQTALDLVKQLKPAGSDSVTKLLSS